MAQGTLHSSKELVFLEVQEKILSISLCWMLNGSDSYRWLLVLELEKFFCVGIINYYS